MPQHYQPKPISFLPPILRRKFILPGNPREMGTLVMIIGMAIILVSVWSNVSEAFARFGKRSSTGELAATAPFRSSNALRVVGVYIFVDEAKVPAAVRGDRVFTRKAKVPKQAQIVWPAGRPQRARVVGEYYDQLLALPVGVAILGFGLWMRRPRIDPYELAMKSSENDTTAPGS
jgi:hypothetical protein